MICNTGVVLTNPKAIIEEEKNYYKKLYSSNIENNLNLSSTELRFLDNPKIPKLSVIDKNFCEMTLQKKDYALALTNLANDKSPGSDGLSTNFYKFFWPDINDLLIDSYNYTFESKGLSQEQKLAVINLIPKKDKDVRYLKNWRPVSLLNTDYKILAKALANRLQKVIGHLICEDQVGYIKGRYIGEAIRTIEDIILLTNEQNTPGFITLIDFEKAFDSIEWPFLFKCLEKFNFGPVFTSWIRILYTNIKSCVGNNGYYSEMFEISRSIRQGCPLSALLFILVAEILAISIRETKKIKGIKF